MFSTASLRFMLSCVNALKGVLEDEILRSSSFPLARPPPPQSVPLTSKVGAEKVGEEKVGLSVASSAPEPVQVQQHPQHPQHPKQMLQTEQAVQQQVVKVVVQEQVVGQVGQLEQVQQLVRPYSDKEDKEERPKKYALMIVPPTPPSREKFIEETLVPKSFTKTFADGSEKLVVASLSRKLWPFKPSGDPYLKLQELCEAYNLQYTNDGGPNIYILI